MAIGLTWLGHGGWQVKTNGRSILIDPFLNDCPTARIAAHEVDADFILVSHGHFDHIADVADIANRTNATVIAVFEIAQWLANKHAVKNTLGMNIGGETHLTVDDAAIGRVKMTLAFHSSQLPDGSYGGNPVGYVLETDERRIYFACDTALFSDMQLIGELGVDAAVLPIGDLFTMGLQDSVRATQFLKPKKVLPAHYNTWPPIEQDAEAWAEMIRSQTDAEPIVIQPGATVEI